MLIDVGIPVDMMYGENPACQLEDSPSNPVRQSCFSGGDGASILTAEDGPVMPADMM